MLLYLTKKYYKKKLIYFQLLQNNYIHSRINKMQLILNRSIYIEKLWFRDIFANKKEQYG